MSKEREEREERAIKIERGSGKMRRENGGLLSIPETLRGPE